MGYFYDTYVRNALVKENIFIGMPVEDKKPPSFESVRSMLPQPFWQDHDSTVRCYWKAWELAFGNIKEPTEKNGFVANYIATAFNDCLFMWDSVFSVMFGKYALNAFNFQRTLDNLYSKQHTDGFICREVAESDGTDRFHRFDPSSTGPNVLPWAEWEYYGITGDSIRLGTVFPVLKAYHRWLRSYRTWPDGTYWSSGWGCGMDNQPRQKSGTHFEFQHGHMIWLDVCLQQVLSAKILLNMSEILGRSSEMDDFREEIAKLSRFINEKLWDEKAGYYFDMHPGDMLSNVKTIGAYWALLSDLVPSGRLPKLIAHLENPLEYKRHHCIPSLPADNPLYEKMGSYWRGGVWAMTNYMVLRGLSKVGYDALAYEIASNHLDNVVKVFEKTGTIWENYSAESASQGNPAKADFVGFGGLTPIAVLFEYVFGFRPQVEKSVLIWDVMNLEEHGVDYYPFGKNGILNLRCKQRLSENEKPQITAAANVPVTLEIRWAKGACRETRQL